TVLPAALRRSAAGRLGVRTGPARPEQVRSERRRRRTGSRWPGPRSDSDPVRQGSALAVGPHTAGTTPAGGQQTAPRKADCRSKAAVDALTGKRDNRKREAACGLAIHAKLQAAAFRRTPLATSSGDRSCSNAWNWWASNRSPTRRRSTSRRASRVLWD